ncbi:uncharacterized membrane protein YtjA (UPF0391 family) [Azospirillum doebereinerae]
MKLVLINDYRLSLPVDETETTGGSATSMARRFEVCRVFGIVFGRAREGMMLYWALVFFVVALIAGALGFGGIASASSGIAQILFFLFLILFAASLIMGLVRRR